MKAKHTMTGPWRAAILLAVCALAGVGAEEAQRRPIAETDLLAFTWIGDADASPDGRHVAFVRVTVDRENDRYETGLWLVPTDGSAQPRPLTAGPNDSAPRWSPDGRRLAFLRSARNEERPQPPQIYLLEMAGGEARPLTRMPRGAGPPVWSPDGKTVAFTSRSGPKDAEDGERASSERESDERKADEQRGAGERKPDERESDVRVITRAVYRFNGGGYLDAGRRTHIWTIRVPEPGATPQEAEPLTSGEFDEQGPVWAPDGSRVFFTSTRADEPYYEPQDSDLYAVPAAGGDVVRIASIDGQIRSLAPSPDGKSIAFIGADHGRPVRSYSQPDLWITDAVPDAKPRNLTAGYDFQIGGGIGGDQRAPRGGGASSPVWSEDGRSILVVAAEHGSANIRRVDVATGRVEPVTTGKHDVMSYTSARRGRLALVVSTPRTVGDLYLAGARGELKQLTGFNDELFAGIVQREPEEFWYTSFDGTRIQGWILKPPDFDDSRKYPLILQIHGGPHSAYGDTFTHEFSWMAAKGFVVLYTNPRGSTSYGQEFANIIQHNYPGDDYKDLMAGVDAVVARGYVERERLGVTGGSGGGVLTNWTIGHTNRFAAAVSQRSIADWTGFWYTADFTLFQPTWFKGAPWEDPQDFIRRSPITYVAKVTTPLMLIEGEDDLRTPPSDGGEQMFRALKYLKRPVVMVRFPGETHELSRSGKPSHRLERLRHIVGWFEKYLQGKPIVTYDEP